jgi:Uncharacterised nucleotidyltransferase
MRNRDLKSAVLAALRPGPTPAPEFSALARLTHRSSAADLRHLLRWLDESGLALYLLDQLQQHAAAEAVQHAFLAALERRLAANRERTHDMLGEFRRIIDAFHQRGVRFCALKGFTLTPDFCPALHLRHQTDFDFLISPDWVENAKQALKSCGYAQEEIRSTGEVTFATPLRHVPSADDDIYARPRHREVDLLVSLRRQEHGVSLDAPSDCLQRAQPITLHAIPIPALSLDDRFTLQVMHAFKHLLGSWVRLSWLLEIARFIDVHHDDEDLWHSVALRSSGNLTVRNAFGLIISLTQALFRRPIPCTLEEWCLRPRPDRITTWVNEFGFEWALSGLDGAKLTLFVHREFFDDASAWTSYLASRIFPFGRRSSIGRVSTALPRTRIRARASQWLHSMRRVIFHTRELASLPLEAIRWKRALRSIERQRALVSNCQDDSDTRDCCTEATSGKALASAARFRD